MPEQQQAAQYRQKAQECREEAARSISKADRNLWLRMADEWVALARSSEDNAALAKSADRRNGQTQS
jgi:hypothetical protein